MGTTRITIIILALAVMTAHSRAVGQAFAQTAQDPQAPATAAPPLEPTPSTQPVVTFRDGELSIIAFNSSLREVLEMVRSKTGAIIDIPPGADERVFDRLGPGPARRVLESLLEGLDFNYAIVSPENDPQALAVVDLFRKGSATAQETTLPETTNLSPENATRAEETTSQGVVQGPQPAPVEEAAGGAEALSTLASSVVRRASYHP